MTRDAEIVLTIDAGPMLFLFILFYQYKQNHWHGLLQINQRSFIILCCTNIELYYHKPKSKNVS